MPTVPLWAPMSATNAAVTTDRYAASDVRTRGMLPALDSMRGIAAIAVVVTHASFWGGAYGHRGYGTALARLDIGVALFFVLSGFLLSRPWFERHARRVPAPRVGGYLWRRLLRIVPTYLFSAVAALTLLPGNHDASLATWVKTVTMTNIYLDDRLPDGLTQMWSLATEVAFYLVLPALMWLILSRRRRGSRSASRLGLVVVVLVLANLVWVVGAAAGARLDGTMMGVWLPGYLTWFAGGIVIAACAVRLDPEHRAGAAGSLAIAQSLRRMGQSPGVCWISALALFAIAATPLAGPALLIAPAGGEAVAKNLIYAAVAALVILPAVFADPDGRYIRTLSLPFLRHLGHTSYGLFSVHLVVLELVARWRGIELFEGRTLELFVVTLLISLAVAELVYRLLERPAMRWKSLMDPKPSITSPSTTPSPATTSS